MKHGLAVRYLAALQAWLPPLSIGSPGRAPCGASGAAGRLGPGTSFQPPNGQFDPVLLVIDAVTQGCSVLRWAPIPSTKGRNILAVNRRTVGGIAAVLNSSVLQVVAGCERQVRQGVVV
eukprot:scaffold433045_cov45-Prasinocladus_malaysianus.AAC.2